MCTCIEPVIEEIPFLSLIKKDFTLHIEIRQNVYTHPKTVRKCSLFVVVITYMLVCVLKK